MSFAAWADALVNLWGGRRAAPVRAQQVDSTQIVRGSEFWSWFSDLASAGVVVNERTALGVGAVYACVSLIAGAVATLPLHVYQRTPDGRRRVDRSANSGPANLWWMLNEQPSEDVCAAVFWEYLVTSLLLHGDAFAEIRRPTERSTAVIGLEPVHPMRVEVRRNEISGRVYVVAGDRGEPTRAVLAVDMLHIPGLGYDECTGRGLSPLRYAARNAVGIAIAADEYQARFFGNGARPDFAITSEAKLSQEQADVLRTTWQNRYGGVTNSHLPAILSGGLKVEKLSLSAEDTQLIETRNFQVVDIARIYGVPPHMIGETEKTTSWGSGVEQMSTGFVRYTLARHLTKIEQEINRKLFPTSLQWYAEFNVEGLLRGDSTTRAAFYRSAIGGSAGPGWMTANEIRGLENLPPVAGGDELVQEQQAQAAKDAASAAQEAQAQQAQARERALGEVQGQISRLADDLRAMHAERVHDGFGTLAARLDHLVRVVKAPRVPTYDDTGRLVGARIQTEPSPAPPRAAHAERVRDGFGALAAQLDDLVRVVSAPRVPIYDDTGRIVATRIQDED